MSVSHTNLNLIPFGDCKVGSDGWSRTALRRQLLQAYISLSLDNTMPEDLVVLNHPNYVDWTLWLRKWLIDYGQEKK